MTNQPAPENTSKQSLRRGVVLIVTFALICGLGYFSWRHFSNEKKGPEPPPEPIANHPPDPTAAVFANVRGVGHMEQFDYALAVKAFEEAVQADPGWTPARVNLAIALLNTTVRENLARSNAILQEIIAEQPNHLHAHYCLGMIALYENRLSDAFPHFEIVSRLDPADAHTWMHMGLTHPRGKESPEAKKCFAEAVRLNPYLNAARYLLAQHPFERNPQTTAKLLEEHSSLAEANWQTEYRIAYSEMGHYADVIGRINKAPPGIGPLPMFASWDRLAVRLADGTTWASDKDLGEGEGEAGDLARAIRSRFGAAIVAFDFNHDGRPDLFLPSAVVRGKRLGDLLLRNEGNGVLVDVTAEAGLAAGSSWGCFIADYDNDGFPDLLLTGPGGARLLRNKTDGMFEDVSAKAGLSERPGLFLSAAWLDIDQDGDLDLLLSRFADTPATALAQLQGRGKSQGEPILLLNVGVAPPAAPGAKQPGLTTGFKRFDLPESVRAPGAFVGVVISDLDGDRDLDVLLLADGQSPRGIWNDRLLRFHSAGTIGDPGSWNAALVLDVNHHQQSDLLLLSADKAPALWLAKKVSIPKGLSDAFERRAIACPPMLQAQAVDLDFDSWTDIVGLTNDRKPLLLHNDGTGKFVPRGDAFGYSSVAAGIAVVDIDGDGPVDLVVLEDTGLKVFRNLGNGNHAVRLDVTGRRDKGANLRTNSNGIGAWIVAQYGPTWSGLEKTTLEAGLRQSCLPVDLGLGKNTQAEVVRIRWPDGVPQAELNVAAGPTVRIAELNRKGASCPILFVWDGQRYRFVTDFLGAGTVGEVGPDGSTRPPRPEESLAIDSRSFVPKNGKYWIKIAEPMDEVLYLDRLQLVAIDHPIGEQVVPDERFPINGPPPTQELLRLNDLRLPKRAIDHRGNDVTALLRDVDRRYPNAFHLRSWLGFAEDHFVDIDFGDMNLDPSSRYILCLHGWTDYAYPESIFAASQAGIEMRAPQLEYRKPEGQWQTWGELGFPAGLPRTMTRNVTELIKLGKGRFRIRTNMQVYWDQVALGRQLPSKELLAETLPIAFAELQHRGFAQEVLPNGALPIVYDDMRLEPVAIAPWKGRLTRLGNVTELLHERDDRFVLCGPGDEIEIAFDAARLPPLREGFTRSFVLRTNGYCKDSSLFTATGAAVEPLPFHGMESYPPRRPPPRHVIEYDRQWNRRPIGR